MAVTLALLVGICAWMFWLPGPVRGDRYFWHFLISIGAGALLLNDYFWPAPYWRIGIGLVLGPLALAPFTFSRGDGDGLWTLVFAYLLFAGGVLGSVGKAMSRRPRIGRRARPAEASFGTRLGRMSLMFAILALAATATGVSVLRWPRTVEELEAEFAQISWPPEFELGASKSGGDPLCSKSCGASVGRVVIVRGDLGMSCRLLAQAVQSWRRGIKEEAPCSLHGELSGGPTGRMILSAYRLNEGPEGSTRLGVSLTVTT